MDSESPKPVSAPSKARRLAWWFGIYMMGSIILPFTLVGFRFGFSFLCRPDVLDLVTTIPAFSAFTYIFYWNAFYDDYFYDGFSVVKNWHIVGALYVSYAIHLIASLLVPRRMTFRILLGLLVIVQLVILLGFYLFKTSMWMSA